jgi:hypothetical protein
MNRVSVAIIAMLAATGAAGAATLINKDADSYTVLVTEDGVKNELAIAAGETITFCNGGCFLTLPNGDKAVLGGPETVEIVNGEAVVK